MNTGRRLGLCLVVLLVLPGLAFAQQRSTTNVRSQILETFDDPAESEWALFTNRFTADGFPQLGFIRTFPEALYRVEPEDRELRALGIQGAFRRQGYNYIEIVPVTTDADGEQVPRSIDIPGRARSIDVWVWGSNFDYFMDIHIRDYRGMVHVLNLGNLNYRGWANLRVTIPSSIPQTSQYVAQLGPDGEFVSDLRGLQIVKMVLWTRPGEHVGGFYLYLDEIKVETDIYRDPFDGEELRTAESVQQLWEEGGR